MENPMNATSNRICAAIGAALCVFAVPASANSQVDVATASCQPLATLQQRIVDNADQGMDALRRFVWRTKFIYGVDMIDVRESLDAWRARKACARQVTHAALPNP
jgi:hypothetical protein